MIAGLSGHDRAGASARPKRPGPGDSAGLLSLAPRAAASEDELDRTLAPRSVASCRWWVSVCKRPSAAGGSASTFWQRFASIENVVAIKVAPFDRDATLDVLRGVAAALRGPRRTDLATTTTSCSTW